MTDFSFLSLIFYFNLDKKYKIVIYKFYLFHITNFFCSY